MSFRFRPQLNSLERRDNPGLPVLPIDPDLPADPNASNVGELPPSNPDPGPLLQPIDPDLIIDAHPEG